MTSRTTTGSLSGIRVLELAGLAPGPFAGMMLADYGASVLRVDRVTPPSTPSPDVLVRGKSSITIDLKTPAGRESFLQLIRAVDVLIDPFRPGVLEKLDLDPRSVLLKLHPRLVVARLTGFRRDGNYATMAGHDINYLAVSGVLDMLGPVGPVEPQQQQQQQRRPLPPSPPGNLLADFAGGGHMCVTGILLALLYRDRTGEGQIVEVNMVDGVSYLATASRLSQKIPGQWDRPRGENLVDGGCPYYNVYECKDPGRYMSVAALEPQFFAALCKGLDLEDGHWGGGKRDDRRTWPKLKTLLEETFRRKTRKEWEDIFDGTDACCLPVLSHAELESAAYQQRAAVTLSQSPAVDNASHDGWKVKTIERGEGGEDVLRDWLGWKKNKDYAMENGGLVLRSSAKL
ncbi:hypothetical protein LTR20_008760 [Exophiala xenobiotica]|nr:hypothetical protein LTR40_006845 [Exophiala xenobiotica]KAK5364824.1 hypothetical protein LTS13_008651 [Exophiala xenobiotica]KAK5392508.1 hypothetical protein LTR79_009974 [Exophiala xenobiotica]KAK5408338.1 hypothetical protein LTR06_007181 [Exophiala xenobiotica]KAK5424345.1 hypothetical protein LTR90_001691 [Exophiala xenobiotica]